MLTESDCYFHLVCPEFIQFHTGSFKGLALCYGCPCLTDKQEFVNVKFTELILV